jgi:predicted ArsR family transcriptional regulator
MDIPHPPDEDVLSLPGRRRLFAALAALRRPATTQELAERVGRHPNTVRVQLGRLADAGLVECRRVRQARGRPRDEWAIVPDVRPAGRPPQAYEELSRWLARTMGRAEDLDYVAEVGREIGHELAPRPNGRSVPDAMQDALVALGFAPRQQAGPRERVRYVLGNCPYREAVAQNQPLVCMLHRGITAGLLDVLDRGAKLVDFVAKDPYAAGCVIDVAVPQATS